jgi:hypothetical protein
MYGRIELFQMCSDRFPCFRQKQVKPIRHHWPFKRSRESYRVEAARRPKCNFRANVRLFLLATYIRKIAQLFFQILE